MNQDDFDPHDTIDVPTLETFYNLLAYALCAKKGHRWRTVISEPQPDATAPRGPLSHPSDWETCLRCGEQRPAANQSSSNITVDIDSTGD